MMDEDRQLALYQIGIQKMWNDVNRVELVWHYVAFDKEDWSYQGVFAEWEQVMRVVLL